MSSIERSGDWKRHFRLASAALAWLLLALSIVFTFASLLGGYAWFLDLGSHLALQCWLVQLMALPIVLCQRKFVLSALILLACLVNAARILPDFFISTSHKPATSAQLKILQFNVFYQNRRHREVIQYIRSVQPDIIALQELTPHWQRAIRASGLLKEYPYGGFSKSGEAIALLSRIPLRQVRSLRQMPYEGRVMLASLPLDGEMVRLVVLHNRIPINARWFARQRQFFDLIADSPEAPRTIAVGDFNTTPWSANYRYLAAKERLRPVRPEGGIQPTWPADFWPLLIPVDHCFVGRRFVAMSRYHGPSHGSDHFSMVYTVALAAK